MAQCSVAAKCRSLTSKEATETESLLFLISIDLILLLLIMFLNIVVCRQVKGLHLNLVFISSSGLGRLVSLILGAYVPWLVGLTREDSRRLFPYLEKSVYEILRESGYLHIQATKPDTAGNTSTWPIHHTPSRSTSHHVSQAPYIGKAE